MERLPAWLEPLPDAQEQRALDEWAIGERRLGGGLLMERAGIGLADLVEHVVPTGQVVVVGGKGNNAGDGLVAARRLRDRGRAVRVLLVGDPGDLRGEAHENLERLPGNPPEPFSPAALAGAAGIVDALLGTGFSGTAREPVAGAIEAINEMRAAGTKVIACDVPSGVDAATGEIAGSAVRADFTATFHAAKPGLWISPGKGASGEVHVVEIGIPPDGPVAPTIGLFGRDALSEIPVRGAASTKFAAGSVLVCGGSTGLTGAPCMAAEAAMRAGAGYVTVCVPASLNLVFEQRLLEVMSVPLPDADGALVAAGAKEVTQRAARVQAVILGPGLGRADGSFALAREVARHVEVPLLLDADGLNAHAGELEALAGRPAATLLTPHAGELARLLGCSSEDVGARRLASVRRAAQAAAAIVVLKGDDTLVAAPDGRVGVSRGGSPGLATAGTGDVLSGVIAALLAKRVDPFTAACAGVFLHAEAGRVAARRSGVEGMIASDVIAALPAARQGSLL